MTYKYKVVQLSPTDVIGDLPKDLQKTLNKSGRRGYRCIYQQGSSRGWTLIFERKK